MKKLIIFLLAPFFIGALLGIGIYQNKSKFTKRIEKIETKSEVKIKEKFMKITSPVFSNNSKISSKYTCDGKNINPPLEFSEVPRETKSMVLIMDDPDAPSKTWVHWVIYNIDPSVTKIEENSVPKGLLGRTDFGKEGYGGPCPPSGTHRYFFKLYALDVNLDVPSGLTKQQVLEKMRDYVLEETELVGLYSRE